jgi:hypothetical protein
MSRLPVCGDGQQGSTRVTPFTVDQFHIKPDAATATRADDMNYHTQSARKSVKGHDSKAAAAYFEIVQAVHSDRPLPAAAKPTKVTPSAATILCSPKKKKAKASHVADGRTADAPILLDGGPAAPMKRCNAATPSRLNLHQGPVRCKNSATYVFILSAWACGSNGSKPATALRTSSYEPEARSFPTFWRVSNSSDKLSALVKAARRRHRRLGLRLKVDAEVTMLRVRFHCFERSPAANLNVAGDNGPCGPRVLHFAVDD